MAYFISWIIVWSFKAEANRSVYEKRGRDEFEYTLKNFYELGLAETIHVTFKLWWTSDEMREDPDIKRDMIIANILNILFFGATITFVVVWFIGLLERRDDLLGLIDFQSNNFVMYVLSF